jgi:hypothetical protein
MAQELYRTLGKSSVQGFKAVFRLIVINNNPFITEGINVAERISGPHIVSLKGKITRQKPIVKI